MQRSMKRKIVFFLLGPCNSSEQGLQRMELVSSRSHAGHLSADLFSAFSHSFRPPSSSVLVFERHTERASSTILSYHLTFPTNIIVCPSFWEPVIKIFSRAWNHESRPSLAITKRESSFRLQGNTRPSRREFRRPLCITAEEEACWFSWKQ